MHARRHQVPSGASGPPAQRFKPVACCGQGCSPPFTGPGGVFRAAETPAAASLEKRGPTLLIRSTALCAAHRVAKPSKEDVRAPSCLLAGGCPGCAGCAGAPRRECHRVQHRRPRAILRQVQNSSMGGALSRSSRDAVPLRCAKLISREQIWARPWRPARLPEETRHWFFCQLAAC